MSTYRDTAHLQDALADVADFLRQIGQNVTRLDLLIYDEENARGLPKPGTGGPARALTETEIDDGPCPRSDPVGEEAIQDRATLAQLKGARRQTEADVVAIRKLVLSLDGRVKALLTPPEKPEGVKDPDKLWCSNCTKHEETGQVRYRGTLCRFCYDVNQVFERLPTKQLIDRWRRTGKRPTSKDFAAAGFPVGKISA